MNKYIKTNINDEIIDIFFERQKNKFDGSEIFLEDTEDKRHKISNKAISDEYGNFIFTYVSGEIKEKTQEEIEQSPEYVEKYKIIKKEELKRKIEKDSITDGITRTIPEIKTRWHAFQEDADNWTTKQAIDEAYGQAITWLYS